MKTQTKVVIAGISIITVGGFASFGLGAAIGILDFEIKEAKKKKAPKVQPRGPEPERIKSTRKRNKVHKQFADIVDKY